MTALAARLIEEAVEAALKQAPGSGGATGGQSRLAGIINSLDPEEAADAMRALEQAHPKDAAIVRTMLFSFSDLPRLSERARALLFDRASIDIVVMALRGTDADFRDTVLSSMPSRGRRLVEGELNSGAFAPPQDIAKARKAIADIVLGMAGRNEIELGGPQGAVPVSASAVSCGCRDLRRVFSLVLRSAGGAFRRTLQSHATVRRVPDRPSRPAALHRSSGRGRRRDASHRSFRTSAQRRRRAPPW